MASTTWHKYELFFTPRKVLDQIRGAETFSRRDIVAALEARYPNNHSFVGRSLLYAVDHSLVETSVHDETIRVCVEMISEVRAIIHRFLLEKGANSVVRLQQRPQSTWIYPHEKRKIRGWARRTDRPDELVKVHTKTPNMVPRKWAFKGAPGIANERIYGLATPKAFVSVTNYLPDFLPLSECMDIPIHLMIEAYLAAMASNDKMHRRRWVHNDIKSGNIAISDKVILLDLEGSMPIARFKKCTSTPDYDEKSYYGDAVPLDPARDIFSWAITFMELVAGCDLDTFFKPNGGKYTELELHNLIAFELTRRGLSMFIPALQNMVLKDRKARWPLKKTINKIWNALQRSPKLKASEESPLDLKDRFPSPSSIS